MLIGQITDLDAGSAGPTIGSDDLMSLFAQGLYDPGAELARRSRDQDPHWISTEEELSRTAGIRVAPARHFGFIVGCTIDNRL